jgi:hypothetical protein
MIPMNRGAKLEIGWAVTSAPVAQSQQGPGTLQQKIPACPLCKTSFWQRTDKRKASHHFPPAICLPDQTSGQS